MSSYKEADICLELNDYFVIRVPKGFEVYKCGITCATRIGRIGKYSKSKALDSAKRIISRFSNRKEI